MHHPLLLSSFEKNQKSINPVNSKTTAIGCGIYPRAEIDRKDFRKFELKKEHFIRNRVHIKCVFCFLNTFFRIFSFFNDKLHYYCTKIMCKNAPKGLCCLRERNRQLKGGFFLIQRVCGKSIGSL